MYIRSTLLFILGIYFVYNILHGECRGHIHGRRGIIISYRNVSGLGLSKINIFDRVHRLRLSDSINIEPVTDSVIVNCNILC